MSSTYPHQPPMNQQYYQNANTFPQSAPVNPPPYNEPPPQYQPPQYPTVQHVSTVQVGYPGVYQNAYYTNYGLYARRAPVSVFGITITTYWAYVILMIGASFIITGIILSVIPSYDCDYWDTYTCDTEFGGINIFGVVLICIGVLVLIAGLGIAVKSRKDYQRHFQQQMNQSQAQVQQGASNPAVGSGNLPVYQYSGNTAAAQPNVVS